MYKKFVEVIAKFTPDGQKQPLYIIWDDGRKFAVDKVIDVRKSASLKVGGCGIRYTCRIGGKVTYLFYEQDKWFVEAK